MSASTSYVRRRACSVAALFLGALVLLASPRIADAAPPRGATVAADAEQWFSRGVAAVRAHDLVAARRAFDIAYSLVPSVDILWNLATTERLLGESVAAVQHLRLYLASPEAHVDRKRIAEADLVPELEAVTARLRIAERDGSTVLVDGKEVSPTTVLDVWPGIHAVVIRRDGDERTVAVDAPAGAVTSISAEGTRKAGSPGTAPAVSGRAAMPVPAVTSAAPDGVQMTTAPGRTGTVLALGGAAVAALTTGVVLSVVARSDQEKANRLELQMRDDDRSCRRSGTLCSDYESANEAAQRSMMLGATMLAVGGVLGGGAIVAWVLWPTSPTRVVPVAGKDVAGLEVSGRF